MRRGVLIAVFAVVFAILYHRIHRATPDRSLLRGAKIFLTGGGSGIGEEIAMIATRLGATVTITGRTASKLAAVCSKVSLANHPGKCHYLVADAASIDDCQKSVENAAKWMGGIDFVISNHMTGRVAKLSEISNVAELYEAYRKTYDANVFGTMCMAKTSVQYLLQSKLKERGFVQVSSLSIFYGIARMSLYSGSKAAMHPTVNAFRVEMPEINWMIHNVGHVTTEVANQQMPEKAKEEGMPPDVCAEMILDEMLLGSREVFFPAVWKPFAFPGIVAFLAGTFIPETMERLSQENYGVDFVKPLDQENPLAARQKNSNAQK